MNARRTIACSIILCLSCSAAFAAEPVGTITALKGTVTLARPGEAVPWSPHVGDGIFLKDSITTGPDSSAKILFDGNVIIVIAERSSVEVSTLLYAPKEGTRNVVFRLGAGTLRALVEAMTVKRDEVSVISTNAIAGVRGTDFVVDAAQKDTTEVFVLEGNVEVRNADPAVKGIQLVAAGLMCSVVDAMPPQPPRAFSDEMRKRLSDSLWLADAVKPLPPAPADTGLLREPKGVTSGEAETARRAVTEQLTGETGSPQIQKVGEDFIVPGKLSIPPSVPQGVPVPAGAQRPAGPSQRPPDRSRAPELF
jgi:hypothetical protein